MSSEEIARLALRERLGAGARYDAATAPARELGWARLGTAYFARKLNELNDDDLDAPSLLEGWTRRHVIAEVGYQARRLALQVEAARAGETLAPVPEIERRQQIALGATLPARALRNLFNHAEVHLNVEWRDLTDADWGRSIRGEDGQLVSIKETAWTRSRAVWIHAVDLANGGSFLDFPPDQLDALVADIARTWNGQGALANLVLASTDRAAPIVIGSGEGATVSGRLADLTRWLTGRGARRLSANAETLPTPPIRT